MKPSDLDRERWRQIDRLFDAALDTPAAERDAFLAEACSGDEELRAQVEALLEAAARGGRDLDDPVSRLGAAIVATSGLGRETRQVGPFRILREVGRGGMGVVYLAEDTRLGRPVALKALPPYLGVGREARQRFVAEARALSVLDHPNIATLYEADETGDGQLYMVFAYYEGETLESRIAQGPLPVDKAVGIATRIADGLAAAHERGIIHRDVKPSNVFLTDNGGVKLLDFGVAKLAGEELTGAGVQPGTVAYMSPEQASGESIDRRSDLWSVGVVLYEMLTGQRPFPGGDRASVKDSILHDPPVPVASLRPDLPKELERVIEKLLCRSPEGRYPTADALLEDLRALAAGALPTVVLRQPPPKRHGRRPGRDLAGRLGTWPLLALALTGAAAALSVWIATGPSRADGDIGSLAVLPLANLTGDSAQQHLVDGVHDALTAELGRIGRLAVISRTSVMRYRDTELSVPEIARQLGVDAIVEGSVLREGDSLAVTAQLIAASPERQLWADTYRRGVGSVFQITGQVARSIAGEIEIALSPEEETRLTTSRPVDPAAYDAYTLGRFHFEQRSPEGFRMAQRYLQRSIEIDPDFAPAYTALAEAYGSAAFFGLRNPAETMPIVRDLVDRALAIDSSLASGYTTLGAVELYWEWDWDGAEQAARRALAINPSLASAHRQLSEVLAVRGRYREALDAVERGSELERLIPFGAFRPVVVLIYMGDFDEAIQRARTGLTFFSDFWAGHWLLCIALAGKGRFGQAADACEEAAARSGRSAATLGALGYAHASAGRRDAAHRVLRELETRAGTQYVGASNLAMIHAGLGDADRAFEWLERAFEQRDIHLVHVANYPFFRSLHADPRFAGLLRRMGLGDRVPGVGAPETAGRGAPPSGPDRAARARPDR